MLYPNLKIRLRLIRARPNFYMISDSPNISLGITRNEWTCLLTFLWSSTIWKLLQRLSSFLPDKTSSFKKTLSTMLQFFGWLLQGIQTLHSQDLILKILFLYQQFEVRQIRILRGGQPVVDFDAADNCRPYVSTVKTMNFQDDIPSIPIDNFKDHYVLVFDDLTSMQDATERCHYPELVGEPLRLELNFTFSLEHVT